MKNKFYITTSIGYVNAAPHLGHALEFAQTDAIARFYRSQGKKVFFLTGTDEHGAKIVRVAEAQNKTPKQLVDENSKKFKDLNKKLNISNDDFIRTSDKKRHWPAAQKLWLEIKKQGDIYKGIYQGLYCVGCEAFITQKDLNKEGKCVYHLKEPEKLSEENYLFRLKKYLPQVEKIIKENQLKIIPQTRKSEILGILKEEMNDLSVSRPSNALSWGVPVPGDKTQTIYVWFEALCNYISALGYGFTNYQLPTTNYQLFWPADIHLIGKDILKFHAIIWPAMLLAAGLALPKKIFVHGFITIEGQKMSKSLGNVADPIFLAKKYGSDSLRYFLLREIASGEDGDFSEKKIMVRYKGDLADGLGNLVSRVFNLVQKYFDGKINFSTAKTNKQIEKLIENFKLNEALAGIWKKIDFANKFIDEKKLWELVKNDKIQAKKHLSFILSSIYEISRDLAPFLPQTSQKILEALKDKKIKKIKPLFPKS